MKVLIKNYNGSGKYTSLEMSVIKNFEKGFYYDNLESNLEDNAITLSYRELTPTGFSRERIIEVVRSLEKKGLLCFDYDFDYPCWRVTDFGLIEYYRLFRHDEYEKCPKDVIKEWA